MNRSWKGRWLLFAACLLFSACEGDGADSGPRSAEQATTLPDGTLEVVGAISNYAAVREADQAELDGAWSQTDAVRMLERHWRGLADAGTVLPSSFDYSKTRGGVFETEAGSVSMFLAASTEPSQDAQIVTTDRQGSGATWLEYLPQESTSQLMLAFATPRGVVTLTLEEFVSQLEQRDTQVGTRQQALERPATACNDAIDTGCAEFAAIANDSGFVMCMLRALPILLKASLRVCNFPVPPQVRAACMAATSLGVGAWACHEWAGVSPEIIQGACTTAIGCSLNAVGFDSCTCLYFDSELCAEQCENLASKGACAVLPRVGTTTSAGYTMEMLNFVCRRARFSGTRGPLSRAGEYCKKAIENICEKAVEGVIAPVCKCVCDAAAESSFDVCFDDDPGGTSNGGMGGSGGAAPDEPSETGGVSNGGVSNGGQGGATSEGGSAGPDEEEGGSANVGGSPGQGAVADAYSKGDPHLRTFDGMAYDFQASGEFILSQLVDEPAGDRIQVREQGLSQDLCPHVTLNTAVAAKLGSSQIAIYAGDPATVVVDGDVEILVVGQVMNLGAGVALARLSEHVYQARWSEHAFLRVQVNQWRNDYHLDVEVEPPASWQGRTRGLLGNFDGQPGNDLELPDGSFLAHPLTWEDFYLRYAAGLRVTEEDTLFDYLPNENVASFARPPLPGQPPTLDYLPAAFRAAAQLMCDGKGITDQSLLDACVTDVACSGGDPSQADWIDGVEAPQQTMAVLTGPAHEALADTFVATAGLHAETEDLDAACRAEFGPDAQLADWLDVKGIPLEQLDEWRTSVGLTTYDDDELLVQSNGQRKWDGSRHYFIAWHNHALPGSFLAHDGIDNHAVDLGSWTGLQNRVLCRYCQNEPCGFALGSQPSSPALSCSDVVDEGGARGDATYWLKPPGAANAFQAQCDMTTLGGGWTLVTDQVAASLDTQSNKSYLYLSGARWYRSPVTTLAWSWSAGQELLGTYSSFDGTSQGSYDCPGSSEKPPWGIGCSSGPFDTPKTIPWYTNNPAAGTSTVCQNYPGTFGSDPCYNDVKIFVRSEP